MKEKACKICHLLVTKQICPNCKTSSLSSDYSGIVIIFDPENSQIAQKLQIKHKGKYALRVR
ncbi:MAG: transcription elongation factor subunit Spt4 [Candidatus Freyarchaeota archaeon]|nr:transcription elongation factor subunit Spt4 [Candidatus Freyarchaeota archaeon]